MTLSNLNDDCLAEIAAHLDVSSLKSLALVSTLGARTARDLRFQYITFGGHGYHVEPDKLTFVLKRNLAHILKRITVGASQITVKDEYMPKKRKINSFTLDRDLWHTLREIVMRATHLESFSFHCDRESLIALMADPSVVSALNSCPLSTLSLTGVTTRVVNAIRSMHPLRVLRLFIEPDIEAYAGYRPLPIDVSGILTGSTSTLEELALVTRAPSALIQNLFGTPPILFPRVRSLTWHVSFLPEISSTQLHGAFPALRSLAIDPYSVSTIPEPSDFSQSATQVHPVAILGDRQIMLAYSRLFPSSMDANNRVVHAMPTTGVGGINPVRFKSLCVPADVMLSPALRAQREMISQVEFLQLYDTWGAKQMAPTRFRDRFPRFLDEETFPNLTYLCISRTWNPRSLAKYGYPDPAYDEAQRDRDKVEWNARLVNVLLEMRNTWTWPKSREPVTLEFRVVASEADGGSVLARDWVEAWSGAWELEEKEGLRRREAIVGEAHFFV